MRNWSMISRTTLCSSSSQLWWRLQNRAVMHVLALEEALANPTGRCRAPPAFQPELAVEVKREKVAERSRRKDRRSRLLSAHPAASGVALTTAASSALFTRVNLHTEALLQCAEGQGSSPPTLPVLAVVTARLLSCGSPRLSDLSFSPAPSTDIGEYSNLELPSSHLHSIGRT